MLLTEKKGGKKENKNLSGESDDGFAFGVCAEERERPVTSCVWKREHVTVSLQQNDSLMQMKHGRTDSTETLQPFSVINEVTWLN